jgi:hypothetical protein
MKQNPIRKLPMTIAAMAIAIAVVGAAPRVPQEGSTTALPSANTDQPAPVPRLITYSGTVKDPAGNVHPGALGLTFALYEFQEGGSPLFVETQNLQVDEQGHYTVLLGATQPDGLPLDLFTSGKARWLGVTPQLPGVGEQPRVLLVGMPYALKASDADTLGGLPASAFVQAGAAASAAAAGNAGQSNAAQLGAQASGQSSSALPSVSGSGTTDFVPLWTNSSTLGNSVLFQSGTGSSAKVGLNTSTPASTLDVNGAGTVRGTLQLPATGTAASTGGKNSQPASLQASSFNSSTKAAVHETFNLQAEPTGNNTSGPSGKLNLLFASGTGTPAETGLSIASNGVITFAPGQTFPGGSGAITGVTAGADLTGGGTRGNVTLNLDTTKVPLLNASNTFGGNQSTSGNISAGGSVNGFNLNATNTVSAVSGAFSGSVSANQLSVTNNSNFAIFGQSSASFGVFGVSSNDVDFAPAVLGQQVAATNKTVGVEGITAGAFGAGVSGISVSSSTAGAQFPPSAGVWGDTNQAGNVGVLGTADDANALSGTNNSTFRSTLFLDNTTTSLGGSVFFATSQTVGGNCGIDASGDLNCTGAISGATKNFKIDHPLDPANKYLVHASVESSEMMNIYAGNIVTDARGEATVSLPEWFEALNTDFRYQLTVVGQFAQAIVAREIENHQFQIKTSAPSVKVSWQVTGVRQDAYSKAHPLVVEQEKDEQLRGYYIHPELYGAPVEKQIELARRPETKRIKGQRAQNVAAATPQH